jgi:alpha-tubulin suppressor-like RCC1 family protein
MKVPHVVKVACLLVAIAFANAVAAPASITVTNIAQGCSANHSLFVESDSSLWEMVTTGGVYYTDTIPQIHEIISGGVMAMAVNHLDTLFVKSDGSVGGMGDNFDGDLGIPTWDESIASQPVEIVPNDVTAVAMGYGHSLFLKSDGSLWAMGLNDAGQLGDGTSAPAPQFPNGDNPPEEIVTNGVIAIAGGGYHSLFLKSDGSLWAMGYNYYGQLGDGTGGPQNPANQFSEFTNQPEEIVASNVTAIAAGEYHSLFLKSDGSLWAMGYNFCIVSRIYG